MARKMAVAWCALASALVAAASALPRAADNSADDDQFALPEGLLIGAGVAAIQTEGAWDADGKSESAADHVVHTGKLSAMGYGDPHLHDVAADSYRRYQEDIDKAAELKLKLYRFSIAWTRVLPTADATKPNAAGVKYYHDLIDAILAKGMVPFATMFHFDHPQILEDQFHGWQSEQMVDKFVEYARFLFNEYSGKVKLWNTINEPNMYCTYFPAAFVRAGLYKQEEANHFQCVHHVVLAHAAAYRAFHQDGHTGQVGINVLMTHARPATTRPEDAYAADAWNQMYHGLVLHPVVFGDYPQLVKDVAKDKVTEFTDAQRASLRDSTDFVGFNVYFGLTASYKDPNTPTGNASMAMGSILDNLPFITVKTTGVDSNDPQAGFSSILPDAIRSALLWSWESYNKPLIVTENGLGGSNDELRAPYFSAFLRTMVSTIKEFNIKVIAYCAWSLIDSFEWSAGFSRPFGLVHVDYGNGTDGTLTRSLKPSSQFWIDLADTGVVPFVAKPNAASSSAASSAVLVLGLVAALFR
ncbi:cyanidin 3-O-glucoside 7-O-glucosyltransferase (acyl-glucose)-like isoform X2 [Thrips palmi]|uniref:beta-glucosidase n=1 Tax=Thrips palmi TaxID=161013 RepID=A0A6P8Y447_THRPL|nr:cyanidin 3-O-glucoside 7-O-glucosyltransferase (acyl-glucose)-like isoform X2 [Thrips palmi]